MTRVEAEELLYSWARLWAAPSRQANEDAIDLRMQIVDAMVGPGNWLHGEAEPPAEVMAALAKDCRNCLECSSRPCDACRAGGVCDRRCNCDDEDGADLTEMDYDPDEDRTP